MADAPERTRLSDLSDREWNIVNATWNRGIDAFVERVSRRRFKVADVPGLGTWPRFKSRTAAYDAVTEVVLAESRRRAFFRNQAERALVAFVAEE